MKTELVFGGRWLEVEVPDGAKLVSPWYGLVKLKIPENQKKLWKMGLAIRLILIH